MSTLTGHEKELQEFKQFLGYLERCFAFDSQLAEEHEFCAEVAATHNVPLDTVRKEIAVLRAKVDKVQDLADDLKKRRSRLRKSQVYKDREKIRLGQLKVSERRIANFNKQCVEFLHCRISLIEAFIEFIKEFWGFLPIEIQTKIEESVSSMYEEKLVGRSYPVGDVSNKLSGTGAALGRALSSLVSTVFELASKTRVNNEELGELSSAERKAADRIKDVDDKIQWIESPVTKVISSEEVQERMKRRGYT